MHVREAFATLEGVTASSIKIEAIDGNKSQKVTFTSTSDKLTKEVAVKSLGDQATKYVVVTFAKAAGEKEAAPKKDS